MIKDKLEFTDYTVYSNQLLRQNRKVALADSSWTRVKIFVPDGYSSKKVEDWIEENLTSAYYCYTYANRTYDKKQNGYTMILRFKENNDALMFKLQGGHQAYQEI